MNLTEAQLRFGLVPEGRTRFVRVRPFTLCRCRPNRVRLTPRFIHPEIFAMQSSETTVFALICAAGVGSRMGLDRPKQYMPLGGRPMLSRTVEALAAIDRVARVYVVVSPQDPWIEEVSKDFSEKVVVLREGGRERAESVRNGLRAAELGAADWVLVHDAARPCVRTDDVNRLIDLVTVDEMLSGGILSLPMADTVKRVDGEGHVLETVPRGDLRRAATPQLFRAGELLEALSGELDGITDEASALERRGARILALEGSPDNIKVTHPGDERLAEFILGGNAMTTPAFRIGQGYDSHRLVEGRPLVLGGVEIPYEKGLDGHSDADVLLHALTDALLGAAALGDIGSHFPPSDPKWKGADSRKLLAEVVKLVHAEGFDVVNADMTVVAERPKIGPHVAAMRFTISWLLDVPVESVSVKAKTNEKMDAVGREEGMAAYAVVLLAARS